MNNCELDLNNCINSESNVLDWKSNGTFAESCHNINIDQGLILTCEAECSNVLECIQTQINLSVRNNDGILYFTLNDQANSL